MLTSSDAKWRCMWHLLVWSINLTLVSQFLHIGDHVAFYILAAISVLVLPVLTAIYSNTSGKHGAGLLRVGLVFCDPVLACLTVTPVLLLNHLPSVVDEYYCLQNTHSWNDTMDCIVNHSDIIHKQWYATHHISTESERQELISEKRIRFLIIQGSFVTPILLALMMGKRTRKMNYNTYLCSCAYWLVIAIEATDLLQMVLLTEESQKHAVYTTEAMIVIVMILCTSYAIITLISYISPMAEDNHIFEEKFDFLYKAFAGFAAVCFCEIPLAIVRCRAMTSDVAHVLTGTFYFWLIKDIVFVGLVIVMVFIQKFGRKFLKLPCRPDFEHKDVFFEPEKRDRYINEFKRGEYHNLRKKESSMSEGAIPKIKIEMTKMDSYSATKYSNTTPIQGYNGKYRSGNRRKDKQRGQSSHQGTDYIHSSDSVSAAKRSQDTSPRLFIKEQLERERKEKLLKDNQDGQKDYVKGKDTSSKGPKGDVLSFQRKQLAISDSSSDSDDSYQGVYASNSRSDSNVKQWVDDKSSARTRNSQLRNNQKEPNDKEGISSLPKKHTETGDTRDRDYNTILKSGNGKERKRTDSDRQEGDEEKRVKFKVDIGQGAFLEMKCRSDSPPVVVHDS